MMMALGDVNNNNLNRLSATPLLSQAGSTPYGVNNPAVEANGFEQFYAAAGKPSATAAPLFDPSVKPRAAAEAPAPAASTPQSGGGQGNGTAAPSPKTQEQLLMLQQVAKGLYTKAQRAGIALTQDQALQQAAIYLLLEQKGMKFALSDKVTERGVADVAMGAGQAALFGRTSLLLDPHNPHALPWLGNKIANAADTKIAAAFDKLDDAGKAAAIQRQTAAAQAAAGRHGMTEGVIDISKETSKRVNGKWWRGLLSEQSRKGVYDPKIWGAMNDVAAGQHEALKLALQEAKEEVLAKAGKGAGQASWFQRTFHGQGEAVKKAQAEAAQAWRAAEVAKQADLAKNLKPDAIVGNAKVGAVADDLLAGTDDVARAAAQAKLAEGAATRAANAADIASKGGFLNSLKGNFSGVKAGASLGSNAMAAGGGVLKATGAIAGKAMPWMQAGMAANTAYQESKKGNDRQAVVEGVKGAATIAAGIGLATWGVLNFWNPTGWAAMAGAAAVTGIATGVASWGAGEIAGVITNEVGKGVGLKNQSEKDEKTRNANLAYLERLTSA
jgi:hypothetical protein